MKNLNIILTEIKIPTGGATIYRKDFRTLPKVEIEAILQDGLQSYLSVGYNSFLLCRVTGTVHIQKLEIKTIDDVFLTDPFGLLN
jgi:hypothetical protein